MSFTGLKESIMIKISMHCGSTDISDRENIIDGDKALVRLMLDFSTFPVDGIPWYVLEMNERDKYFVLTNQLERSEAPRRPDLTKRFEMHGDDPDGFDLIFMATFFYASGTGRCSEGVKEYMKSSRRITGRAPWAA